MFYPGGDLLVCESIRFFRLHFLKFKLEPKKPDALAGQRSASVSETATKPQGSHISLLYPLRAFCTFGKRNTNKVFISEYTFNFAPVISLSFVSLERQFFLISFILKYYPALSS